MDRNFAFEHIWDKLSSLSNWIYAPRQSSWACFSSLFWSDQNIGRGKSWGTYRYHLIIQPYSGEIEKKVLYSEST